jgi:prolyl-tRNA synthetase
MRYSRSFIPTLREDPAEARKNPSHRLLLRGGYVRQIGAGTVGALTWILDFSVEAD